MKHYLWTILLTLIFLSGYGQQNDGVGTLVYNHSVLTEKQLESISDCARTLPDNSHLSIALIENGNLNFYGLKNEKDSTLAIDNSDNVFEIGSITKVFTATLLANLVLDKKVGLDDKISEHLNFSLKDDVEVSFKQLATHTSGLPRVPISLSSPSLSLENPYKDYGEEKLKIYLIEKLELDDAPGAKSSYSNLGFGLLGYLLGLVESMTYEDLLQTRIFSKYHMANSTTNRDKIQEDLIKGLNDTGEEVPNWDLAVHVGAGGILSTVKDLSKFALAQFDEANRELELTRAKHFAISDNYSMGLAWGLVKSDSGEEWNWHNGGTGGYTSSMILNTNTRNGVIILSNVSALGQLTSNITGLASELMKSIE